MNLPGGGFGLMADAFDDSAARQACADPQAESIHGR